MDLIEDFVSIEKRYTDAPEVFLEAAGYWLVSQLLGRFFICYRMKGNPQPNMWFVLSSIPGMTRRSTVVNHALHVYKKAMEEYYEMRGVGKDKEMPANKLISGSLIEDGTPEGIADHITEMKGHLKMYAIVSPEFGIVFQKMQTRDYAMGVSALFSKLYYGEGGSQYLSKRGGKKGLRYIPPGLYVTMFTSMQEAKHYLRPEMMRQGLLRRITIIYVKPEDLSEENYKDYIEMNGSKDHEKELDTLAKEFVKRMDEYTNLSTERHLEITTHPNVLEMINKVGRERWLACKGHPDNVNIYFQSMHEHLAKLSMLKSIAEGKLISLEGHPTQIISISPEHAKGARDFLERCNKNTEDLILELSMIREPIRTHEDPINRVYRYILSAGKEGIGRSEIYRKANMLSKDLDEILKTLTDQKRIRPDTKTGRKGPDPTIWYAT